MKQFFVLFLLGFLVFKAFAQPSVDLGVFGGVGTYIGDLTNVNFQKSINPAYGGFVRYNFNPRYGLRFNVINGTIGAEGALDGQQWKFSKNVMDFSLNFEWNYMRYIVGDKETHWSTFLFGGIGIQMYDYNYTSRQSELAGLVKVTYFDIPHKDGNVISPTIPFGLGFKFNLSKRWGIGFEGGLRKTFSDKLDDLDDPLSYIDKNVSPEARVNFTDKFHNNDWTAYVGFHLVYKVIYGNREWGIKTPKHNILDWGITNKIRN
jgi:hypothetical protein